MREWIALLVETRRKCGGAGTASTVDDDDEEDDDDSSPTTSDGPSHERLSSAVVKSGYLTKKGETFKVITDPIQCLLKNYV